ncbi:MAG: hypothetical protein P8046_03715 [Anaerolineales bacterium]
MGKQTKSKKDETIAKDSFDANHDRVHDRYHYDAKSCNERKAIPDILFDYLDSWVYRLIKRNNHFFLAAQEKELVGSYEHHRSQ